MPQWAKLSSDSAFILHCRHFLNRIHIPASCVNVHIIDQNVALFLHRYLFIFIFIYLLFYMFNHPCKWIHLNSLVSVLKGYYNSVTSLPLLVAAWMHSRDF